MLPTAFGFAKIFVLTCHFVVSPDPNVKSSLGLFLSNSNFNSSFEVLGSLSEFQ